MAIAKGYAATDASKPLTPFTFERREPNEDDVVIAIKFAGICHSDIHQARNEWGNSRYPMVPGHEIAGIVSAVGSKVTKYKVGDRVGVGCFVNSCTTCATRDLDLEHYMPGLVQTYNDVEADGTTPTYGGYSDSVVVKEGYVLSIPENLPLDAAASATLRWHHALLAAAPLGRPVPARKLRSSAWAVSATWASRSPMRWVQTSPFSARRCRRRRMACASALTTTTPQATPRPSRPSPAPSTLSS